MLTRKAWSTVLSAMSIETNEISCIDFLVLIMQSQQCSMSLLQCFAVCCEAEGEPASRLVQDGTSGVEAF